MPPFRTDARPQWIKGISSGRTVNRGSLKATTADAELFSILSNHMIRVSAPHPQRREGPSSTQLTTILCGYLAPFVWLPGSFVYLRKCWYFRTVRVSLVTCFLLHVFFFVCFFNGKFMMGTVLKENKRMLKTKHHGVSVCPDCSPFWISCCVFSSLLPSPGCAPDRPLFSLPSDVWGTYGAVKLLSARACLCLSRLHQRD